MRVSGPNRSKNACACYLLTYNIHKSVYYHLIMTSLENFNMWHCNSMKLIEWGWNWIKHMVHSLIIVFLLFHVNAWAKSLNIQMIFVSPPPPGSSCCEPRLYQSFRPQGQCAAQVARLEITMSWFCYVCSQKQRQRNAYSFLFLLQTAEVHLNYQ